MFSILFLLKASLVLAILTTAYACLVKRETFLRANRWLLWMNVAATLLLPIIPMPDFDWMPDAPAHIVSEVLPKVPSKLEVLEDKKNSIPALSNTTSFSQTATENQPFTFWDWVTIGYELAVCVLIIKFLIQLIRLWRLKREGVLQKTENGLLLIETHKITSPFSFFHWIFYNPTHHSDDEWAQILAHERIHAQQWHSIDIVGAELLKIVFWFNPFAWWHQRLVQETLEFITDRAVLNSGIEKKSYQYHLLRSTLSTDKQAFTKNISTPYFNQSTLKNRIAMMNRTKSNAWAVGKYGLFIASLWLCAAFTKPYQAQVATKIVEKVPELQAVLQPPITAEMPKLKDFVMEKIQEKPQEDSLAQAIQTPDSSEKEPQEFVSTSKYIVYKDSVLHWVVTPKTTMEDLVEMRKEFAKRKLIFDVTEYKLDPLNLFVIGITAKGSRNLNSGCTIRAYITDDSIEPIPSRGGYISIGERGGCGTVSNTNIYPNLKEIANEDEKIAKEEWTKNRLEYLEIYTVNRLGHGGHRRYNKMSLKTLKEEVRKSININMDDNGFISIAEKRRNDNVLLNGNPSTIGEIEKIKVENLYSAIFKDVLKEGQLQRDYYILVFTEN